MAEFTEVCRQAIRYAKANSGLFRTAERVEVFISTSGEAVRCSDGKWAVTPEEAEADIMQWAADHPEPRYPTWKEWQDTTFPNNDALMRPCIFESEEYFDCMGIKPIGGDDDERQI